MRANGRGAREVRPVRFTSGFTKHAEGSVLAEFGDTRVLCTASVEEKVPPHLFGAQKGWVTAEYGMLPRSTHTRTNREASRGKQGGRTMEIQRLIGRALRAAVDSALLGQRTITLDCDVLQADGGTRTAAISGAWLALVLATRKLRREGTILQDPIRSQVVAVSVGVVAGVPTLDLDYKEDSGAEVDMNVVATDKHELIEVQGTAEGKVFGRQVLDEMLTLALEGIGQIAEAQRKAIA